MSLAVKAARGGARGDPGFLGDIGRFIGGAAKTVGGLVGAIPLPGTAIIGSALRGVGGAIRGGPQQRVAVRRGGVSTGQLGQRFAGRSRIAPPVGAPTLHGGQTEKQAATARAAGLACPKGHKPNESSYFLKDGTFVLAGTKCVRIRRRNPLNPRAADRAISRLESSKKAVTKINRFSIRKKKCPN